MVGDRSDLGDEMNRQIERVEQATADCTGMRGQVMVSYGSRWEIVNAARKLATSVQKGELTVAEINEDHFAARLATAGVPDPDLMIRTSGEQRISNYLLWQLSYAELMFVPTAWPDFTLQELATCMQTFDGRERRFGGILPA